MIGETSAVNANEGPLGCGLKSADSVLPSGYKQTRAGMIPSEWDIKRLGEISPRQSVGLVINPSTYFNLHGTVPMLVGSNVYENHIDWSAARKITVESNAKLPASQIFPGDLVMVRVGDPGVAAVVPPDNGAANCASMMIVRGNRSFTSDWLCYLMNSDYGRNQVKNVQYGTAQKQFNISDAVDFIYPVPPVAEQRAIAGALSDVDVLLEELDRLIVKKRDLKQATMQQLLSGHTRLPGFEEEWRKIHIGAIGRTYGGLTGKSKGDFGTGSGLFVPFTNVMENTLIDCQKLERVHITERETQNRVMKGDVLFNGSSETPEEVAMCALVTEDIPHLYLNSFCFGFRIENLNDVNSLYFVYLIRSDEGRKLIQSLAQGSTRYNISKTALLEAEIALPDMEEQIAISQIIKDMESDILILEERRDKAAAIKQAMMQDLLTGRTRLV